MNTRELWDKLVEEGKKIEDNKIFVNDGRKVKDENGKWKAKDKKWNNKLSEDWKTIIETTNKNIISDIFLEFDPLTNFTSFIHLYLLK